MMVWIVSVDGSSRKSAWARQSSHACGWDFSSVGGRRGGRGFCIGEERWRGKGNGGRIARLTTNNRPSKVSSVDIFSSPK